MSTFKTGSPNFLVPGWLISPITDPTTVRSAITPRALHKIFNGARAWKLNMTLSWSVTGISPNTYTNAGTAALVDEPFSAFGGDPTTETEIEQDWGGFGWGGIEGSTNPMSSVMTFTDGAVAPSQSWTSGLFGFRFGWIAQNPARASTWSDEELELEGFVSIAGPTDAYTLVAGVSEPSDIGFTSPPFPDEAIAWERGEPGTPFFGSVSIDRAYDSDGYSFTLVANLRIDPTEYWGWNGKFDTSTGEPV